MGLIGKILQSSIKNQLREIQMEMYPNFVKSPRQILPPGIDAVPIADDQGVMIMIDSSQGKAVQIGIYPDPQAESGEVRFYSRDDDGNQKSFLWLKKDGTIEINGSADFAVSHTDLNLALQSLVTSLNANFALKLDGAGTPGTSTLDISGAKVATVKLP